MVRTVISRQGDTLDALIWREAGLKAGDISRVLAANPGLADLSPVLPLGTAVTLPATSSQPQTRPLVQLWD
ncbi:MAG TPA: tail protein X [Pedomonas sp.]|uniref:tail protein X n=1 Tax=Pedomonas sp. TaxID=2976421 RepID=UPI002F3EEC39